MDIRERSVKLLSKLTQGAKCPNRDQIHYYERPHLAKCGHIMCKSCWEIKNKCASCDAPVKLNELKEDGFRNEVVKLVERNLHLFKKIKETGNGEVILPPSDVKEHVQSWLGSSQNHFSIPPTQTENLMLDANKTDITKQSSLIEIVHKINLQEEFDLIQNMEEFQPDVSKAKDKVIPSLSKSVQDKSFALKEVELAKENNFLRRSTRRVLQENNKTTLSNQVQTEAVIEKNNSPKKNDLESSQEKSFDKDKHRKHWKNVKNMEKVFSKLNKRNVKKLNVSIEMFNKNRIISKSNECIEPEGHKNTPYIIEENTSQQITRPCVNIEPKYGITKEIIKSFPENTHDKNNAELISEDHKVISPGDNASQLLGKIILPSTITHVDSQEIDLPPVYIGKKKSGENSSIDKVPQPVSEQILHEVPERSKPQEKEIPRASIRKRKLTSIRRPVKQLVRVPNKFVNSIFFNKRENHSNQVFKYQRRPINKIGILNVSTPEGNFVITGENICIIKEPASCSEKSTQTDSETPLSVSSESHHISNLENVPEKLLANPAGAVQCSSTKTNTASRDTMTGPFKITESVEKEMSNEMICEEDADIFHTCTVNKPQVRAMEVKNSETPEVISQDVTQKSKLRSKRSRQTSDEISEVAPKKQKDCDADQDRLSQKSMQHTEKFFNNEKKNHFSTITEAPDRGRNSLTLEFDEITSKAFAQIDADLFEQKNKKIQEATNHNIHQQEPPTTVMIDENDDILNNYSTPLNAQNGMYNVDSDSSFVEETPQKQKSAKTLDMEGTSSTSVDDGRIEATMVEKELMQERKGVLKVHADNTVESPLNLNHFSNDILHESTPLRSMTRRSLDFSKKSAQPVDQGSVTTCTPSTHDFVTSDLVRTTVEREFMERAFQNTPHITPVRKTMSLRKDSNFHNQRYVLAFSCISSVIEKSTIKAFAKKQNWDLVDTFNPKLTHLIVGVDNNKAKRTVKYIQALAAGKWIVSIDWINQCIRNNCVVDEAPYEVLDMSGCNSPYLSRTATTKIFEDITFYCHPPFSMFEPQTLEDLLVTAGGKVVKNIEEVSLKTNTEKVALVVAEPENTLDEKHMYLAIAKSVVPVNYEWVLNSLGSYSLQPLPPMLLCSIGLLHFEKLKWPQQLLVDVEDSTEPDEIENE